MLTIARRSLNASQMRSNASREMCRNSPALLQLLFGEVAPDGLRSSTEDFHFAARARSMRGIISLSGFDSGIAKKYNERKLMGYSPQQMFDVVAAVEHYDKFVPWCQRSSVLSRKGDDYLEAELEVGFQIFVERYISKVEMRPHTLVRSRVGDATLFSHLDSQWRFQPGPTPASVWLTFEVDFAFKSPLYRQVASIFFEEVVLRMMVAFEKRCEQLYGPSSLSTARSKLHQSPATSST